MDQDQFHIDLARLSRYSLSATIPAPCRDVRAVEHRIAQRLQPSDRGVFDHGLREATEACSQAITVWQTLGHAERSL